MERTAGLSVKLHPHTYILRSKKRKKISNELQEDLKLNRLYEIEQDNNGGASGGGGCPSMAPAIPTTTTL